MIDKDNVLTSGWNNESMQEIRTALQQLLTDLGDSIEAAQDGKPVGIELSLDGNELTASVTLADGETELSASIDLTDVISAGQAAVEIVNNLVTDSGTKALSAAMGLKLDRKTSVVLEHMHWAAGTPHVQLNAGVHKYYYSDADLIFHFYGKSVEGQGQPQLVMEYYEPSAFSVYLDNETSTLWRFLDGEMVMVYNPWCVIGTATTSSVQPSLTDGSSTLYYYTDTKKLNYCYRINGTTYSILHDPDKSKVYSYPTSGGSKAVRWNGTQWVDVGQTIDTSQLQPRLTQGTGISIDGNEISVDAEVVQPATPDGTFVIRIGTNTYTVNLNHTHENMAKLEKHTPATMPDAEDMEEDTIYAKVEDGEVSVLYIGGVPFYGGGGGASSGPVLRRPDGSSISLGENFGSGVSKDINVKGMNLTEALTIELSGTGLAFDSTQPSGVTRVSNTQLTVTAEAANALNGVDIKVNYNGTAYGDVGTLSITGGSNDNISRQCTLTATVYETLAGVKLTGTQWLQTDYYPNANTEWELECKFTANGRTDNSNGNGTKILRCNYDTSGQERFTLHNALGGEGNQPYFIYYMNKYGSSNQKEINMRDNTAELVADHAVISYVKGTSAGTFTFNGGTPRSVTTALQTETLTSPMCIGYDPALQIPYNVFDLTIYELKITENGTVVRDWVPKKKDGVTGLLDIATNGTGTFLSSETAKTSGLASDELVAIPLT